MADSDDDVKLDVSMSGLQRHFDEWLQSIHTVLTIPAVENHGRSAHSLFSHRQMIARLLGPLVAASKSPQEQGMFSKNTRNIMMQLLYRRCRTRPNRTCARISYCTRSRQRVYSDRSPGTQSGHRLEFDLGRCLCCMRGKYSPRPHDQIYPVPHVSRFENIYMCLSHFA